MRIPWTIGVSLFNFLPVNFLVLKILNLESWSGIKETSNENGIKCSIAAKPMPVEWCYPRNLWLHFLPLYASSSHQAIYRCKRARSMWVTNAPFRFGLPLPRTKDTPSLPMEDSTSHLEKSENSRPQGIGQAEFGHAQVAILTLQTTSLPVKQGTVMENLSATGP